MDFGNEINFLGEKTIIILVSPFLQNLVKCNMAG